MTDYEQPDIPAQQQDVPGVQSVMIPVSDCGKAIYRGFGKLEGRITIITGGDSGIAAPWPSPSPGRALTC